MISAVKAASRFKVHVSFCDADSDVAYELIDSIRLIGRFDVTWCCAGSDAQEYHKDKVKDLIAAADAIVFVLSPDYLAAWSWEIEYAGDLSKQIQPMLCKPLHDTPLPSQLAAADLIQFNDSRTFAYAKDALTARLATNMEWLQEHTRLLARALEWDRRDRPSDLLLTGEDVLKAKVWALSRPEDAPVPTDLHVAYVCAGEAAHEARQLAEARAAEKKKAALVHVLPHDTGFQRWSPQTMAAALIVFTLMSASVYVVAMLTGSTGLSLDALVPSLFSVE